jgi:uncharacterized protein
LIEHPGAALQNAIEHFPINDVEANAIRTHMWPLTIKPPTSREAAVVNVADTYIGLYECSRFKLATTVTVWLLFIFNFMTFSNK